MNISTVCGGSFGGLILSSCVITISLQLNFLLAWKISYLNANVINSLVITFKQLCNNMSKTGHMKIIGEVTQICMNRVVILTETSRELLSVQLTGGKLYFSD
jgi:hypothetical protein